MASKAEKTAMSVGGKSGKQLLNAVRRGQSAEKTLKEKQSPMGVMTGGLPTVAAGAVVGVVESNFSQDGKVAGVPVDLGAALVFTGLAFGAGNPMFAKMAVGASTIAAYNATKSRAIRLPFLNRGAAGAGAEAEDEG